jgi:hypothetical protein
VYSDTSHTKGQGYEGHRHGQRPTYQPRAVLRDTPLLRARVIQLRDPLTHKTLKPSGAADGRAKGLHPAAQPRRGRATARATLFRRQFRPWPGAKECSLTGSQGHEQSRWLSPLTHTTKSSPPPPHGTPFTPFEKVGGLEGGRALCSTLLVGCKLPPSTNRGESRDLACQHGHPRCQHTSPDPLSRP